MLDKMLLEYSSLKPQFDVLKKQVDALSKKIKEEMLSQDLYEADTVNGSVKLSVSERVSFDNDILSEILTQNEIDAFKTVPDEDRIADLIDKGAFEFELIQPAVKVTEVVTMRWRNG